MSFKEDINEVMNGVEVVKKDALVKKEKKKTEYRYEFKVSGIDFIASYFVSGKEKMKLVCLLSKTDENGLPTCFIQEKGQNVFADEVTLKSFFNGLGHSDCFPNGDVKVVDADGNICESVPKLHKTNNDNRFIRCFLFMIRNKFFVEHVRQGIINLEIIYALVDRKEARSSYNYDGDRYTAPWFFNCRESYGYHLSGIMDMYRPKRIRDHLDENGEWVYKDLDEPSGIETDNIHLKLFKAAIAKTMENSGCTKMQALKNLYDDRGQQGPNGEKKITMPVFRSFILLANRYDEPFAIKCMEDYLTNPKLNNISASSLNSLFMINVESYRRGTGEFNTGRSYYGGYRSYTVMSGNLVNQKMTDEQMNVALNLEKNRFWDYILQSTCVGLGKNLENYIQLWTDYITSCLLYFGKVSDKYPEHLQEVHDIMIDKYSTYQSFNKDDKLKERTKDAIRYCEMHNKQYKFHIFTEVKEFLDEATAQGNCLASADYAGKVADGRCWIGSFRKVDSDDPILTVEIDPATGKMVQIKARYNHDPQDKHAIVLKKFQDKIYKNMIEDGVIRGPSGYNYAFDRVLSGEAKAAADEEDDIE